MIVFLTGLSTHLWCWESCCAPSIVLDSLQLNRYMDAACALYPSKIVLVLQCLQIIFSMFHLLVFEQIQMTFAYIISSVFASAMFSLTVIPLNFQYSLLKVILILLEVSFVAFVALDHRWEKVSVIPSIL